MANRIQRASILVCLRAFLAWGSFFVSLDASIALNRWWLSGGFGTYLQNLTLMLGGFTVFIILFSKSKIEMLGFVFLCIAVYFIGDYEIGGL